MKPKTDYWVRQFFLIFWLFAGLFEVYSFYPAHPISSWLITPMYFMAGILSSRPIGSFSQLLGKEKKIRLACMFTALIFFCVSRYYYYQGK